MDVHVGPSYLTAGNRLSSMNFLLHNYSSQSWDGTATVKIYLSTNNNISTADTLTTTASVSTRLNSKQSTRVTVTVPPVIPSHVSGNYWVGVIVDKNDFNAGNNDTDGWDAAFLYVYPRLRAATDDGTGQIEDEEQIFDPSEADFQIYLPIIQQ